MGNAEGMLVRRTADRAAAEVVVDDQSIKFRLVNFTRFGFTFVSIVSDFNVHFLASV